LSFYILDIETNGIDAPDKLWCIVCKDLDSGEVATWNFPSGVPGDHPEALKGFLSSSISASGWIGHNIIGYDLPILKSFIPSFTFEKSNVIDTLVVARLLHYNIDGGNSLDAWGNRLGFPKSAHSDFSSYSQQLVDYCINDVLVTEKLYAFFSEYIYSPQWARSLRLEHDVAWLCNDLHDNGFSFDAGGAEALLLAVRDRLRSLESELAESFQTRPRLVRSVHPKVTRSGTLSRVDFRWLEDSSDLTRYNGGPFSLIAFEPFNPGSPKQCVERLWECGWQPYDKTKGHIAIERELSEHRRRRNQGTSANERTTRTAELEERLEHFRKYGWKVNEANLATLPRTAPEAAHKLVEWLTLESRRSTLEEWLKSYNPSTGRIHGRFNHIGAWTGRMSHNSPNMANIPGHGSLYGDEMRSLWRAEPGSYLVGVDADGIQLRILAHYMNDKDYINAIVNGNKDDGTDQHSLNKRALGSVCSSRDVAKTFVYAFLLGAGTGKVSQILDCSLDDAKDAVQKFLDYYPGLRALRDHRIPADADRGYFIGLDGRLVACDSQHLMLAGYLQNGEAVIMKTANLLWINKLEEEKIPFRQVNFVHDEWQVEVQSLTHATKAGNLMVRAIEETGSILKLNCPLTGNAKIGRNWLETH
jgi:DNA polymerase-1